MDHPYYTHQSEYHAQLSELAEKNSSEALKRCIEHVQTAVSEMSIDRQQWRPEQMQTVETTIREIELAGLFYRELYERTSPLIARYHISRFNNISISEVTQLCRETKHLWKNISYILTRLGLSKELLAEDHLFQQQEILESIRLHFQTAEGKRTKREKLKAIVF